MKKSIHFLAAVFLLGMTTAFTSCVKDSIMVSSQDLRFGLAAETQTLIVRANCNWTIAKNNDVDDWYTISPTSGQAKDSIVTVTVNDYSDGDFRGSSFVVSSTGGNVYRRVFISQNKLHFDVINKVFGLTCIEHWKTDYYDQIIEDEYECHNYDPYDTMIGQRMYFFENGQGIQRRVIENVDTVIYYSFEYAYDPDSSIFHIMFHLVDGGEEPYNPEVLCASDSLYRIFHEYKPHWFERADMRRVGTILPDEKAVLQQKLSKRKKSDPIFITK